MPSMQTTKDAARGALPGLVAMITVAACALAARVTGDLWLPTVSWWLVALACIAMSHMIGLVHQRSLWSIVGELRRSHRGDLPPRSILGNDPLLAAYNRWIDGVTKATPSPARSTAKLDQDAITLTRAMRNMPTAWIITDREGVIVDLHPRAAAMLAISDRSSVGSDIVAIIAHLMRASDSPAEDHQSAARDIDTLRVQWLADTRRAPYILRCLVDETPMVYRVARADLSGRRGDREGWVWSLEDQTKLHRRLNLRDDLLATATHELRTPLHNLQSAAELLVDDNAMSDEARREFCTSIQSEASRLGRLIDDLLSVDQMDAGVMVGRNADLDLLAIIDDVIKQNEASAVGKAIELVRSLPPKMSTVSGDRDKLHAAVLNIVANAIKYTDAGGKVTVAARDEDGHVCIAITDTGPGIAPEYHGRIFEKFFRVPESSDAMAHRGNGLGLAFTGQVVQMHQGTIELDSDLGRGSTFTVRLPASGHVASGAW